MKLLSGIPVSESILNGIKDALSTPQSRKPKLVFVLVGNHAPSQTYVSMKMKACQKVGIVSEVIKLEESVTDLVLKQLILELNQDDECDGIIVQMPLPEGLDHIPRLIDPQKDVDGFTPENMGKLLIGDLTGMIPCTPSGIFYLLRHYGISCDGKHVGIMGRSNIVGKPLANLLSLKIPKANASVSLLHHGTQNLKSITKSCDILIVAIGKPELVDASYIKEGAVVIDVGINRVHGKIKGDCQEDSIKHVAQAYSPVPGGVGPMTIACLLLNTYLSYKKKFKDATSSKLVFQDNLLLGTE